MAHKRGGCVSHRLPGYYHPCGRSIDRLRRTGLPVRHDIRLLRPDDPLYRAFFTVTGLDSNFLHTAGILNPVSLNAKVPVCPEFMDNLVSPLDEELKQSADSFQVGIAQNFPRVILLQAERQLKAAYPPVVSATVRKFYNAVEQHFRRSRNTEFYARLLGVNEKSLSKEVKALTEKKVILKNKITEIYFLL